MSMTKEILDFEGINPDPEINDQTIDKEQSTGQPDIISVDEIDFESEGRGEK